MSILYIFGQFYAMIACCMFFSRLYEACIRCIRTIVTLPEKHEMMFHDPSIFPVLMKSINLSMTVQECTCEILMSCCKVIVIDLQSIFMHNAGSRVRNRLSIFCIRIFKCVLQFWESCQLQNGGGRLMLTNPFLEIGLEKHTPTTQLLSTCFKST